MAEDKEREAAISRQKEKVAQEVEQHKDREVDLEGVSGGWFVSYTTDPPPTTTPIDQFERPEV